MLKLKEYNKILKSLATTEDMMYEMFPDLWARNDTIGRLAHDISKRLEVLIHLLTIEANEQYPERVK